MNINLHTWFSERELDFCPPHFIMCNTPLTEESKSWILERCKGRFYIQSRSWSQSSLYQSTFSRTGGYDMTNLPFFEDHEEATLYELTWS